MPQERCGDRNRLKPCNAGLDARQRQTEMITDETTDDTDDIERAGLSPDLDFYSNRIHAAGVDTGTDVGFSWGAPRDDGRVIVTVDQSRVEAMDQLKREVQQIQRYCRKEFGNEKPHLIELVNKFFGPKSQLYLLFYSRVSWDLLHVAGNGDPSDNRRGRGATMVDQPKQQEYDDEQASIP